MLLKLSILSILTLGFYYPYHIVELREYLWSHTYVGKNPLSYKGDSSSLLRSFIIVAVSICLFKFASFSIQLFYPDLAVYFDYLFKAISIILIPFFLFGSYSFKVNNTYLGRTRFTVDPKARGTFIRTFYLYLVLAVITGGLLTPLLYFACKEVLIENTYFGSRKFRFFGSFFPLFAFCLFSLVLFTLVLTSGLLNFGLIGFLACAFLGILLLIQARSIQIKQVINCIAVKEGEFRTTYTSKEYFILLFKYGLIAYFTLGLAVPVLIFLERVFLINHTVFRGQVFVTHTEDGERNSESVNRAGEIGDLTSDLLDF